MNLRYEILKACAANPGAPVDEIADAIKHDRKKTGWAVRDCAKEGLLSKRLDDVTGQLGYTLTAAGKKRLAEGPASKQGSNMRRGDSEGGDHELAHALNIQIQGEREEGEKPWRRTVQLGRVYSATLDEKKVAVDMQIYNKWERMLASLYFGNATLLIDCDADDFSYGLYD